MEAHDTYSRHHDEHVGYDLTKSYFTSYEKHGGVHDDEYMVDVPLDDEDNNGDDYFHMDGKNDDIYMNDDHDASYFKNYRHDNHDHINNYVGSTLAIITTLRGSPYESLDLNNIKRTYV